MILGDLFDTATVPAADLLETYYFLNRWLAADETRKLYNVAGNHDMNKVSNVLSSFQLLGRLLTNIYPTRYVQIEEPLLTPHGYVIPHVRNQELFDLELSRVPECKTLFLHCNYNNNFAAQSDQSLNISTVQAENLPVSTIVIAHEHHTRKHGKVLLPGNQIASSIADWLPATDKFYAVITDGAVELVRAAARDEQYVTYDWKAIEETSKPFIRITGTAETEELGAALSAINRYRASSGALVIGNAVLSKKDESIAESFTTSLESVQRFSIVDALRKILTAEEFKVVEPFTNA